MAKWRPVPRTRKPQAITERPLVIILQRNKLPWTEAQWEKICKLFTYSQVRFSAMMNLTQIF